MEIEQHILSAMKGDFAMAMHNLPAIIEHKFKEGSLENDSDQFNITYIVELKYPENNTLQTHEIVLTWNRISEEYGIELNTNDGDVSEITPENIMIQLYFDLGMKDIDENLLN